MVFEFNNPLLNELREGSDLDPFVPLSTTSVISNNKIILTELPSQFEGVTISGYAESKISSGLIATTFYCNYLNGIVSFASSENGKTVTANFKGRGVILTPAERIYTKSVDGSSTETFQDVANSVGDASTVLANLNASISTGGTTKTNLDSSISSANVTKTALNDMNIIAIATEASLSSANVVASEATRIQNESVRIINEGVRVNSEVARVSAENLRKSAEDSRIPVEINRNNAESARIIAENLRIAQNNNTINAENIRIESENTRISSEIIRESQEDTRQSNESTRQSQEENRQNTYSSGHINFKGIVTGITSLPISDNILGDTYQVIDDTLTSNNAMWRYNGTIFEKSYVLDLTFAGGYGANDSQVFTATENQTLFTLTEFPYLVNVNQLMVYVTGIKQIIGVNYTETSTNSFTLTSGVVAGTKVEAFRSVPGGAGSLTTQEVENARVSSLGIGYANLKARLDDHDSNKVGVLANLNTSVKTDIVSAINEQLAQTTAELVLKASTASVALKASITYVDEQIASVADGTPESFVNLTAIQSAYPIGNTYVKLNLADGYVYKWNGVAWVQGWEYLDPILLDDVVVSNSKAWSSENTLNRLAIKKIVTGESLSINDAMLSVPMNVVAEIMVEQVGSGTPSPANIRAITGHSNVTITVANVSDTDTYVATPVASLYGIPGATDTVNFGTGIITHKTKFLEFDGTEVWTMPSAVSTFRVTPTSVPNVSLRIASSHFQGTDITDDYVYVSSTTIRIRCTDYITVDAWKAYLAAQKLAGTPVTVAYELATATTETASEGAQSITPLVGVNTISHSANGNTSITYYAAPPQVFPESVTRDYGVDNSTTVNDTDKIFILDVPLPPVVKITKFQITSRTSFAGASHFGVGFFNADGDFVIHKVYSNIFTAINAVNNYEADITLDPDVIYHPFLAGYFTFTSAPTSNFTRGHYKLSVISSLVDNAVITGLTSPALPMTYFNFGIKITYYGAEEKHKPNNVFAVGNEYCDYRSLQEAIDQVEDSETNPILLNLMPGTHERFQLLPTVAKPARYISIIGDGKEITIVKDTTGLRNNAPGDISTNGLIKGIHFLATHDDIIELPEGDLGSYGCHVDEEGTYDLTFEDCDFTSYQTAGLGCGMHQDEKLKFINCNYYALYDASFNPTVSGTFPSLYVHGGIADSPENAITGMNLILDNCRGYTKECSKSVWIHKYYSGNEMNLSAYRSIFYSATGFTATIDVTELSHDSWGNNVAELNYTP